MEVFIALMIVIIAIAAFIIGIVVGVVFNFGRRPAGNLRVDQSEPSEEPYLFLELVTDVRSIMRKKFVTFRVKIEDFLPHE